MENLTTRVAWGDWVVLVLGIVLILSPFILGFSGDASAEWSDIVIGAILVIISAWRLMVPTSTAS